MKSLRDSKAQVKSPCDMEKGERGRTLFHRFSTISAFSAGEDIFNFGVCSKASLDAIETMDWKHRFQADWGQPRCIALIERKAGSSKKGWKEAYLRQQEDEAELEAGVYQGMC